MDKNKKDMLNKIWEQIKERGISFKALEEKDKAGLVVEIADTVLWLANRIGSGFVSVGASHYIFGGTHWTQVTEKEITDLLKGVAIEGGIHNYKASHHRFATELYKQFRSKVRDMDKEYTEAVKINCGNGTLVFGADGVTLQPFNRSDNFFYQLGYQYNPSATAPEFQRVLDDALPRDAQKVLQEYIASVFFPNFNHQKALLLYGRGGEGKSLIISIISAALGRENVVERSIEGLCVEGSSTVADLENKLLNICYEMDSKFNISNFKRLVSKEPMTAKRLYADPYTIYNYASLLFACNELPKNIELTNAYFRRLIILPFLNSIPEDRQDRTIGDRIIKNELSGVLNWIVEGAERLMGQGYLSSCEIVEKALAEYKIDADSVASFIDDCSFEKLPKDSEYLFLQELFDEYKHYCDRTNCHACSRKTFSARLKNLGFEFGRKAQGMIVFTKKSVLRDEEPEEFITNVALFN